MGKQKAQDQEMSAQAGSAIGVLAIVFGVLAAIKDKLGLNWPATVLLTAGVLVGLGYLAWRLRTGFARLLKGDTRPATALKQEAAGKAADEAQADAEAVPAHPELTTALRTAGAIGRDQIIRASEVKVTDMKTGSAFDFLMPEGRTYEDLEKHLSTVAGMFEVTRLHLKMERSRDNERRVKLLKLHEPPFAHPFPAPTRQEIETFAGVPLGHDSTGQLAGVSTFDKASLLIGGMTQMGKTTLVNGLITCLLIAYEEFDLYLLDGKLCGLTKFEKIATRYEASAKPAVLNDMLDELIALVDERYEEMQDAKRNRKPDPKFRPVFFIIDEAADFYNEDGTKESQEMVQKVTEKSRYLVAKALESGVSTVMLTQRPSRDAIPVKVRAQFLYRMCLYVDSQGTAKVALGDSYFETVAPINPVLLDSDIKGQAVMFAQGVSTLIRGFYFKDEFIWEIVDEVYDQRQKKLSEAPESPLKQAIDLMRSKSVEFMPTPELASALGVTATDSTDAGKKLSKLFGVSSHRAAKGVRGYRLADLTAAAMSAS